MHPFGYQRPATVAEAVELLATYGPRARLLAGGTDLLIGLRDRTVTPELVIDLKRIAELRPVVRETRGALILSATAVMADLADDPRIERLFPALAEAAAVVGSVQIRNRATLVGNICHGSPAADTAPPLLVYGAVVAIAGPDGTRRIDLDDFITGPHTTGLRRGELVTAVELPLPPRRTGSAYTRLTRRWGTDLASVTMCVAVDEAGTTRLAYGSVGPRPVLRVDGSGVLVSPTAPDDEKARVLDGLLAGAEPSPRSMRAGPEYRLAMLRVLGRRALQTALERLAKG